MKEKAKETILVVPLTTQKHSGDWYYNFLFNNLEQWAVLNQIKVIDTKRLEKITPCGRYFIMGYPNL